MTRRSPLASFALAVVCVLAGMGPAAAIDTPAREAILMDYATGHVLFQKNAEQRMPPASMTKIMTAYLVFERLKDGRLSLDDTFVVSKKAWRKGGSKMFVEVGNEVSVENLLHGVIVQSGNDSSIVLAEGIAGTTEAFAKLMTQKARELGMDETTFKNSTGWPHPEHRTSAEDLAILSRAMIRKFPTYYEYFAEREFTWNDIRQFNRNPLLGRNMGVDGIKTGHTQNAGYGLTASAERKDRRLILVVNGLESAEQRADESARLLEWGFREFDNYTLFAGGETVERASVWLGQADRVPLVIEKPLTLTMKREAKQDMTVKVTYESPIPAPIESGERLATLHVTAPGGEADRTVPLVAGASVPQLGPVGRIVSGVEFLIFGAP
jgi:D-alanyl-D-alanine carboxypeptidase (penicillin-binding protein 5/6)